VGLLLATFGTFWSVEGLGIVRPGGQSLEWPGGDLAILALLVVWLLLSRALVRALASPHGKAPVPGAAPGSKVPEEV